MAGVTVARALEIIKELDEDELRLVQQAVEERLDHRAHQAAKELFYQSLLATGLLKKVKAAPGPTEREAPLVPIKGQPLSETILEERR